MLTASCHCGAVKIQVSRKPSRLTSCNCSICRRYGALWAYYTAANVKVSCEAGATSDYAWGGKRLKFVWCRTCGCLTHWQRMHPKPDSRMGVNARNFDPADIESVRIRHLDGAASWKYLD